MATDDRDERTAGRTDESSDETRSDPDADEADERFEEAVDSLGADEPSSAPTGSVDADAVTTTEPPRAEPAGPEETEVDVQPTVGGAPRKSKWFAALSNLLLPGLGYFYINRGVDDSDIRRKGIYAIALFALGMLTSIFGVGLLIVFGLYIYTVYDCFLIVEEERHGVRAARR
jgi:hypothetical protein